MTGEESAACACSPGPTAPPLLPTPHSPGRFAALMPDGPLCSRAAPAGPLAHVRVSEVEVGDDAVALFEAEKAAHAIVVGDGAGAPDAGEAEGVGCQLHVLDGRGAGRVVLQRLDLVASGDGDHGDNDGR